MSNKMSISGMLLNIVKYVMLIILVGLFLVPLVTIFFGAFKTTAEFGSTSIVSPPSTVFNFNNFKTAFIDGRMLLAYKNTVIILFFSLFGSILSGAMVAFVLSRFDFRFNKIVNILFAGAIMIPNVVSQIAVFQIISKLGLFNTMYAPILLYSGTDIVSIYIFLQFLNNISVSLDESAIIDGANYLQIFTKIIVPLLSPAIVTVIITKGISIYNDFYIPFLYMPSQDKLTISTSLFKFKGPYGSRWEVICAGILIIVIPTMIVFVSLQKYIYSGLVSGSVKE